MAVGAQVTPEMSRSGLSARGLFLISVFRTTVRLLNKERETGGTMNMGPFVEVFFHSPMIRLAAILLAALAWSSAGLCSPISEAVQQGDLAKVTALLNTNPSLVLSKDQDGSTLLHLAARTGQRDVAALLLAHKAEVDARCNDGNTPLHLAASTGKIDVAKLLLAHKANINARNVNGDTPLYLAVSENQIDMTALLLASKANVNVKDNLDVSPLSKAGQNGNKDLVNLLRKHGGH